MPGSRLIKEILMLMALGPLSFEVLPLNATETQRVATGGWVDKPVVGRRPVLEWMGDGQDEMTIIAKLFPAKFGGLSSLAVVDAMRSSGMPHFLVRGDGTPLGWYAVITMTEKSTYLDQGGVGQVIEVNLKLRRADAPGAAGYMAALLSLA
jgi:uncharacterized protein